MALVEEYNPQEWGCYPSTMVEAEGMRRPLRFRSRAVEGVERIREVEGVEQIQLVPREVEVGAQQMPEWAQERR
jgi:hypothetical protein